MSLCELMRSLSQHLCVRVYEGGLQLFYLLVYTATK